MLLTCVTKALLRAMGIISEDRDTKLETHFDVDLLTTLMLRLRPFRSSFFKQIYILSGNFLSANLAFSIIAAYNVGYFRVAAAIQYRGCQICMVQVPASAMAHHLQECSLRCKLDKG